MLFQTGSGVLAVIMILYYCAGDVALSPPFIFAIHIILTPASYFD